MKERKQFVYPKRYKGHPIYFPEIGSPRNYSLPPLDIGAISEEEKKIDVGRKFEIDLAEALKSSSSGRYFPPTDEGCPLKDYSGNQYLLYPDYRNMTPLTPSEYLDFLKPLMNY